MAKKRKSLVALLFDMIFAPSEANSPEEQVAAHRASVLRALDAELAAHLAAALFAKKTLDTTRQVDIPFPDDYFAGKTPVDAAARIALATYTAELERFKTALEERDTTPSLIVAKGLTTWIVSLHTLSNPGLLAQGREIWSRLDQAGEGVEAAHKFLLRREPSDVERTYFNYRPIFLTSSPSP